MDALTIQRFPAEVHGRVFRYLTLRELIDAAHVCQHWRNLAFDNEAYWDDVTVDSVDPIALEFAEHRMRHGRARPMRFTFRYTELHLAQDDPVLKRLIPMLRLAVPRAWHLDITVESMYRLDVEDALCAKAPNLRTLWLKYHKEPRPELPRGLPLAWDRKLFGGLTGRLRRVHLHNIILPLTPTAAFQEVDEVWWMHAMTTGQDDFPCYLFDFFPKATRLRMAGGPCKFLNAPLPPAIIDHIRKLKWVDLTFPLYCVADFFTHLPLDSLEDLTIAMPHEDLLYRVLEPLLSNFHLDFSQHGPNEFVLSVRGDYSTRVRRFAELLKHYWKGGPYINALMENDAFMEQVATLSISVTLWSRLHTWMQAPYPILTTLIITLNEGTLATASLPEEIIECPTLSKLVIQAENDRSLAYVYPDDVVAFSRRLAGERKLALELRRVFLVGDPKALGPYFEVVDSLLTTTSLGDPVVWID